MPVIRTFVSHHGGDYADRVAPILRRAAPLGVRPWIDKIDLQAQVGLPLDQVLQEAIFKGPCSSVSLFLTREAVKRKWIEQEVEWALEDSRVLPILLDPREEMQLPERFRGFMERRKVLWLEPANDPAFLKKYAASVLQAGAVGKDTTEITLYLGHRSHDWDAALPEPWADKVALDLRLELTGHRDFSPTEAEWQEIERGLETLRAVLPRLAQINVCGPAPLGVGALIGKVWDRTSGINGPIRLCSYNAPSQQIWTTDPDEYDQAGTWTPERAQHVKMDRPAAAQHKTALLALLPEQRAAEYMPKLHRWNERRGKQPLVLEARLPERIADPGHAQQVLRECVGVVRFIRRACPMVEDIEIVPGYPLALAPLFLYHLRTLGPIHLYDEVKKADEYRLATTLG